MASIDFPLADMDGDYNFNDDQLEQVSASEARMSTCCHVEILQVSTVFYL